MEQRSIYLSPSTQENNIGASNYGTEEKVMNQITDILEPILEAHGLIVYRNKPTMTLKEAVADSNSKKPDFHFAIHSNAWNKNTRGCEVYVHRFGGEGEKLARAVYKEIEAMTPTGDRGIKESANFFGQGKPLYEPAYTKAPAALIEIAFHDNFEDAMWILDNMEKIAEGLAKGILNYFEIPMIDDNTEYKATIQEHCGFGNPDGVWKFVNLHPYANAWYQQWADSYK